MSGTWLSSRDATFRLSVDVEALNRAELLADVTAVFAGPGVRIVSAQARPPDRLRVRHSYTVRLSDPARLPALLRAVRRVPGVYDVHRAGAEPRHTGASGRKGE